MWAFDISKKLDKVNADARRVIAQGRDPESTGDSSLLATPPARTHNDGDNEVTGIHVSDGSTDVDSILGAEKPRNAGTSFSPWRIFFTGQHGANITYEIVADKQHGGGHDRDWDW